VSVPRWKVLHEADRIVDSALAGSTEDPELNRLARMFHVEQSRAQFAKRCNEAYERAKLSPMFKMCCFYVAILLVSCLLAILQKALEKKLKLRP
jgi:hypothetical protein